MVAATTRGPPGPPPKRPLGSKSGQQPSVATEKSRLDTIDEQRQALRGRLDQKWQDAVAKFRKETGKDLGDFRGGKDGVLGTLRERFAEDNEDTKKNNELWAVVDKTLNSVIYFGSLAAEVGSIFFSPASVCFNALETLISIPQAFKKLRDDLFELFNEIMGFLANFVILKRVDEQIGLDTVLVEKISDILLAMVDVCMVSEEALRHKHRTMASKLILKDDKVREALTNFQRLIEEQNNLNSTMTLEAVLQTRADQQATGDTIIDMSAHVNDLHAFQADEKRSRINQQSIRDIDNALGVTENEVRQSLHALESCRRNMLANTMDVFREEKSYREWFRLNARRKFLFVQGDNGSGRTHLLAAIDLEREKLAKDGHETYIAYYAFQREDGDTGTNDWTPLRVALGVMASQIARQFPSYRQTLSRNLEAAKNASELEDFWRELKLDNFEAPDNSAVYLFFDGLNQLKTSPKDLKMAYDLADSTTDRSLKSRQKLRVRVIFTGNKHTVASIGQKMSIIDMEQLNEPLLKSFVEREMERILGDRSGLKDSAELNEAILQHAGGSFTGVLERLAVIKEAISSDLGFDELLEQIKSNTNSSSVSKGAAILDEVCSGLSPEHQEQLKEVLYWAAFGFSWLDVQEMEAAVFLLRKSHRKEVSLEPLESKIRDRFKPALRYENEKVIAHEDVEKHMRDTSITSATKAPPSRITVDVRIENVDESSVKQFFWDLNNAMNTGTFDFTNPSGNVRERLSFSFAEAQYTIATRCLEMLNDDKVRPETGALLGYACLHLPRHIYYLDYQERYRLLSPARRRNIGHGLVDFLTDEQCIQAVWSTYPIRASHWIYDHSNIRAIGHLLTDPLIFDEMDARYRRVAERMTTQTREKPAPFLESLAVVAASRWLDREQAIEDQELACYDIVNAYLRLHDVDFDSLLFRPETAKSASGAASEKESSQETTAATTASKAQAEGGASDGNAAPVNVGVAQDDTSADQTQTTANKGISDDQPSVTQEGTNSDLNVSEAKDVDSDLRNKDENLNADEMRTDSDINAQSVPEDKRPLEPEEVTDARVKQALEWSLKRLRLEEDSFVFQRVGSLLVRFDRAAAIEYLKKAYETAPPDDLSGKLKTACALAEAYAYDDTMEAYNALDPVIKNSRSLCDKRTFSEDEKSWLFKTFREAAAYLTDQNDYTGAINALEDALRYRPNDSQCRYNLINLLCRTDQLTRAQELFDQWEKLSTDDKSRGPQALFLRAVRSGGVVALSSFFHTVGRSPLHTSILQALKDAIEYDGDDSEYSDKSALHFARGLALATTRDEENLESAKKEWEACMYKDAHKSIRDDPLLKDSWMYAAQYYFDQQRKKLEANPHMSVSEKKDLLEDLQGTLANRPVQEDAGSFIVNSPRIYTAAFARLAGLDKIARGILRRSMATAIRILRDDDPDNDSFGLILLIKVLRCYGDIHGECICWSLYDRDELAERREKRWAAKRTEDDPGADNSRESQRPESSSQSTTDPPDDEGAATTSSIKVSQHGGCNGCDEKFEFPTEQEIWSCTFCPDVDFCATCYEKLKNKQLGRVTCSHEHEHSLEQHLDYDREEVQGQNVKVGWHFVGQNSGRGRRWEGGRIVQLKDWLDGLAREWEVGYDDATIERSRLEYLYYG